MGKAKAMAKGEVMANRQDLMPMDIVLYDGKLWVVSTAHNRDEQDRQMVNLSAYKRKGYIKDIPSYQCKIIHDEKDRKQEEISPGIFFYPNTDFGQAPKEK